MRMRTEMRKAAMTEKAMPRWDEPRVLPSAMEEPRNRLNPMDVVPTRDRTRLEEPSGMLGTRPAQNLGKKQIF